MFEEKSLYKCRICTNCGNEKLLTDFHFANRNENKRQSRCKVCVIDYVKKYVQKNKEKIKEKTKERYKKASEEKINGKFTNLYKVCNSCKNEKYYKLFGLKKNGHKSGNKSIRHICLECYKDVHKKHYEKNKTRILQKSKNRTDEQKAIQSQRVQIYKNANPEKVLNHKDCYSKNRKQRILDQSDGTLTKEFLAKLFATSKVCPDCNRIFSSIVKKSLDHIKPISKGGLHSATNVRICCLSCNIKKGANDSQ